MRYELTDSEWAAIKPMLEQDGFSSIAILL